MKKNILVLLVVCLCFLTACAPQEEVHAEPAKTPPEVSSEVQLDIRNLPDGQCYRQTTWPLPEGQCVWDGRIYSYSNVPAALGVTDADGSTAALPLPDAEYLYGVCEAGDALALLAGTYPAFYFDADGEPVTVDAPEGRYSVTTYDSGGAILSTVPLAEVYPEEPRGFDGGSGASYYLLFTERVVKIGADGQQLAEQAAFDRQLLQILAAPDAVYVRVEGDTLYETEKVVRLNAETLQAEAEFFCAALDVHGMGLDVDGRLLLVNQEYLLQPDFETGTVAAVLSWKDNANTAANNYQTVLGTDEGFFALNSSIEAACFYERLPDGETLAEPTDITLYQAAFSDLPLTVYASEFQKLYPEYRVTVIEAKSTEEKELALTELGTGKGYDIYLLRESQWQQLRDADVFEDLLPWMNADSSAPLSVMRPSIRQALTKSGNLYRLPVGYRISTYIVDPNRLRTFTPEAILTACTNSDVMRPSVCVVLDMFMNCWPTKKATSMNRTTDMMVVLGLGCWNCDCLFCCAIAFNFPFLTDSRCDDGQTRVPARHRMRPMPHTLSTTRLGNAEPVDRQDSFASKSPASRCRCRAGCDTAPHSPTRSPR